MGDNENGDNKGFWQTIPGILAQLAAVIVAVTGLIQVMRGNTDTVSPPGPEELSEPGESVVSDPSPEEITCKAFLEGKLGMYSGTSEIVNIESKLQSGITLELENEGLDPCNLRAEVELLSPRGGEGTLRGTANTHSNIVELTGVLNHPRSPKVWNVTMSLEILDNETVRGLTTWVPRPGTSDQNIYEDKFVAEQN